MILYQCPKCKSRYIKEVMYEDYGTLYTILECENCGEAGEYSYFDLTKNNKPLNANRAKPGSVREARSSSK